MAHLLLCFIATRLSDEEDMAGLARDFRSEVRRGIFVALVAVVTMLLGSTSAGQVDNRGLNVAKDRCSTAPRFRDNMSRYRWFTPMSLWTCAAWSPRRQ